MSLSRAIEEHGVNGFMSKCCSVTFMGGIKAGVSIVVGILILISFIGYTGTYDAPGVPKPADGFCGVTSDAYSNVPGSGAMLDIDVTVTWDDDDVWVGIITPEDYASLDKQEANDKGEIVLCVDAESIDFIAGGPDAKEGSFNWVPDGEAFHIMIGSPDEGTGDDGGILPGLNNDEVDSQNFNGEFDVSVEADVSGGWAIIALLLLIEVGAIYLTAQDR